MRAALPQEGVQRHGEARADRRPVWRGRAIHQGRGVLLSRNGLLPRRPVRPSLEVLQSIQRGGPKLRVPKPRNRESPHQEGGRDGGDRNLGVDRGNERGGSRKSY